MTVVSPSVPKINGIFYFPKKDYTLKLSFP